MHISEGVLRPEIIVPAAILTAAWTGWLVWRLESSQIPRVAAMSALFFCASFIHVPLGATSVHLVLGGLVGAVLGARAFLAILVGLALQAVFFGYGGLTSLGANAIIIGAPAVLAAFFTRGGRWQKARFLLAGFVPTLASSALLSLTLALNGEEFFAVAGLAFAANIALMVIEGIICLFGLSFIWRVNKELLPCEK